MKFLQWFSNWFYTNRYEAIWEKIIEGKWERIKKQEIQATAFEEAKWVVYELRNGPDKRRWVKENLRALIGDAIGKVEPGHKALFDYDQRLQVLPQTMTSERANNRVIIE